MTNMINEAKSTKVLQYKEELYEFYQYLNLILLYRENKKGGSFLELFYRDRTTPIFLCLKRHYPFCKNKNNKKRKAGYRNRTDDHRITNAML